VVPPPAWSLGFRGQEDKKKQTCIIAMDIRSIIDSEDAPLPRKPSVPGGAKQEYRPSQAGLPPQAPAHDNRRDIRPPQPSPLQTSAYNDSRFPAISPHDDIRSPYQRNPSLGLNNGPYPPPQIPHQGSHYGQQSFQYAQRESNSASGPLSGRSFGHTTPLSQTPTASTPGSASAFSSFPRPTSSHSIPTPNSTHNSSALLRESPQPSHSQSRTFSQPPGPQHYMSQPCTPLGPPTTTRRPSLNTHRESPGEYGHRRSLSGGHYSQQDSVGSAANKNGSPSAYREHQSSVQAYPSLREREQSLSVSPKTRLPSLPSINRMGSMESPSDPDPGRHGQVTPAKRKVEIDISAEGGLREPKLKRTPSRSVGVSGLLNEEPPRVSPEIVHQASQITRAPFNEVESDVSFIGHNTLSRPFEPHSASPPDRTSRKSHVTSTQYSPASNQYPIPTASNHTTSDSPQNPPQSKPPSSFKMAALKTSNSLIDSPLPPVRKSSDGPKKAKRRIQESLQAEALDASAEIQSQPAKKKIRTGEVQDLTVTTPTQQEQPPLKPKKQNPPKISRWQDVPIFAQSARGPQRTMELFQRNLTGTHRGLQVATPTPYAAASRPSDQTNGTPKTHGQPPAQPSPANGATASTIQPPPPNNGPLGPWEHSVTDTIPADEVIRIVADFLFPNVVLNSEVGVAPAGGGRGLGAVLEIEAKIGRLIDRNTNDRLQLPVMNECVISHTDPNMRIAFESSMTEVSLHPRLSQPYFTNDSPLHSTNTAPSTNSSTKPSSTPKAPNNPPSPANPASP